MSDELPIAVEQALEDNVDPDDVVDHLDAVKQEISAIADDTRAGNLVYAQQHVLEAAVRLLRECYDESDEYGEREAEMMAVAIILGRETENEVW